MATRKLVLTTKQIPLPEGVVPGSYVFTVTLVTGESQQVVTTEATEAIFTLTGGDYTASAVRIDAAGAPIGDAAIASFTVEQELVHVADILTIVLA